MQLRLVRLHNTIHVSTVLRNCLAYSGEITWYKVHLLQMEFFYAHCISVRLGMYRVRSTSIGPIPYTLYTRYKRISPYNLIHLDLNSLSQPLFVQIYFFWCQMIALGELRQYDVSVCLKAVI
jgi:hypothetical protein